MSEMYDTRIFRPYEAYELGRDGYPFVWHKNVGPLLTAQRDEGPCGNALDNAIHDRLDAFGTEAMLNFLSGVKDLIRADARHRCVRCNHRFVVGVSGEWESAPEGDPDLQAEVGRLFYDQTGEARPDIPRGVNWSDCNEGCTHTGPLRCQYGADPWCGITDESITGGRELRGGASRVQAAWRILTVHHLNERKHDLRWHNLVALCQKCHLSVQRRVQMERPYPWLHSKWFWPYVAAHYAAKYEGVELSREATMDRLPELLELGMKYEAVERMPL